MVRGGGKKSTFLAGTTPSTPYVPGRGPTALILEFHRARRHNFPQVSASLPRSISHGATGGGGDGGGEGREERVSNDSGGLFL